ncbi:hypothetical protein CABS01_16376 [Colletotrichum abscissum]|uniref:uncharacterized protein n=1 Tax=Colletotrichum abscissum TaxID=1671311 RepID=UPI0027D60A5C|nr:uncharacterized protein CABS01_16376 [Colletotrichum abscissum]KAK1471333.1 hypothetical protein CABS01_16376 [Colletotrichum abscissum]
MTAIGEQSPSEAGSRSFDLGVEHFCQSESAAPLRYAFGVSVDDEAVPHGSVRRPGAVREDDRMAFRYCP